MHVGDLDGETVKLPRGHWQAIVTITVHDASHRVVASARVSGTWSGAYSGTGWCTTDSSGQCRVTSETMRNSKKSVTFRVDDVTHETLWYELSDNHDPDDDSDGIMITVSK